MNGETSRTQAVVDETTVSFCSDLLSAQKGVALYPRTHPRVVTRLDHLRSELQRVHEETGKPFTLATLALEDLAQESGPDSGLYLSFSRLLKLHVIEKLTLHPDVSSEELYEFLCLLRTDIFNAPPGEDDTLFDPVAWPRIRLSFYTPSDFPDDMPEGTTILERSAGLHRAGALQTAIESLPEDIGAHIRKGLVHPRVLRRIASLRRDLANRLPVEASAEERRVDLVGGFVKDIVERLPSTATRQQATEALGAVNELLDFVETNLEAFAAEAQRHASPDGPKLSIENAVTHQSSIFNQVSTLESEKARLGRLFRLYVPAHAGTDRCEHAPPPPPPQENDLPLFHGGPPVRELLSSVSYDAAELRESLELHDPGRQYLQVVVELLADRRHAVRLRKNIDAIVSAVAKRRCMQADSIGDLIGELSAFAKRNDVEYADDLIARLVEQSRNTTTMRRLLNDQIAGFGGAELATRCMERLVERHPQSAIDLLVQTQEDSGALREQARSGLVAMCGSQKHLTSWLTTAPEKVMSTETFQQILEEHSPEDILQTFRHYFAHASAEDAQRVINLVDPNIPNVEIVLVGAVLSGSVNAGYAATVFLKSQPLPSATRSLIQIVRLSNYKDAPCTPDVRRALEALVLLDSEAATSFLDDVRQQRTGWLTHEYKREIRDILEEIDGGQS